MAAATMCSINSVRMLSVSTGLFLSIYMRFILLHHLFSKDKLVKLVLKMYSFFFFLFHSHMGVEKSISVNQVSTFHKAIGGNCSLFRPPYSTTRQRRNKYM